MWKGFVRLDLEAKVATAAAKVETAEDAALTVATAADKEVYTISRWEIPFATLALFPLFVIAAQRCAALSSSSSEPDEPSSVYYGESVYSLRSMPPYYSSQESVFSTGIRVISSRADALRWLLVC